MISYFWLVVIILVFVSILVAKRKSSSGNSSGGSGRLSADGNTLEIDDRKGIIAFQFFPEKAKLKITQDGRVVFSNYPQRLILKENFATMDTVYRETFTGTDNNGNYVNGLGGYKSAKAISGTWFELKQRRLQQNGGAPVDEDLNCYVDTSGVKKTQITSFVHGNGRRELGEDKCKELGKPKWAPARDFTDTFGGFDDPDAED
jgi:hypothetical protein